MRSRAPLRVPCMMQSTCVQHRNLLCARGQQSHPLAHRPRSCRYLLETADGALHFAQKGKLLWTRHEALAQVAEALVLPLPAAGNPNAPAPQPALSATGHITLNGLVLKVPHSGCVDVALLCVSATLQHPELLPRQRRL